MFEAARLAAYLTRIDGDDPAGWVSAAEALSLATEGSAKVLGNDRIGRIAPGFEADLVFLSLAAPHFVPLRSPVMQMMYAETGASVEKVMIGGRLVYEGGRMLTVDETALRRQAEAAAQRLDEENGPALISARDTARYVGLFCCGLACPEPVPNRKLS
jgi:guanine deaminase